MVTELKNRYGQERQMFVYPDATGSRTNTNSGGMSDHIILQNNGFKVVTEKTNPNVSDSIVSVNSMLCSSEGERKLLIDPDCRKLRECMIKYTYKPNTKIPDKDSGYDHMADALRYVTHRLFAIRQLPQTGYRSSTRRI